jgi:hypothetical protein
MSTNFASNARARASAYVSSSICITKARFSSEDLILKAPECQRLLLQPLLHAAESSTTMSSERIKFLGILAEVLAPGLPQNEPEIRRRMHGQGPQKKSAGDRTWSIVTPLVSFIVAC